MMERRKEKDKAQIKGRKGKGRVGREGSKYLRGTKKKRREGKR